MSTNDQIKDLCTKLRLYALPRFIENEAHIAREQEKTHMEFLHDLLAREVRNAKVKT